jgi:hypothetical protein
MPQTITMKLSKKQIAQLTIRLIPTSQTTAMKLILSKKQIAQLTVRLTPTSQMTAMKLILRKKLIVQMPIRLIPTSKTIALKPTIHKRATTTQKHRKSTITQLKTIQPMATAQLRILPVRKTKPTCLSLAPPKILSWIPPLILVPTAIQLTSIFAHFAKDFYTIRQRLNACNVVIKSLNAMAVCLVNTIYACSAVLITFT